MEQNTGNSYFKSNLNIFVFAAQNWKLLSIVAVIAGILAAVFSGPTFIAPQFTSEAVIYPANLGGYSGETRLEQMQQYLESNSIRDSIISKFNLWDEYEIDSTKRTSKNQMIKVYSEHISFDETKFESINITASSADPVKARNIVAEIIDQLNQTIRRTEREKYKEILLINKRMMDQKKVQLDSLEDLIREYSTKYGILDYISQSEEVTEGYMKFLLEGKKGKGFEEAKQLYDNLEEHGRKYHNWHAQLNVVNSEYMGRLHNYEHAKKDVEKVQTYSNVLVSPEVPDKKSSPIRWLIVLSAMVAATVFTFVIISLREYISI